MFTRANLFKMPLESTIAHDGRGAILTTRVAHAQSVQGACNFIDYTIMPPGSTIGLHAHRDDEEEYYLILSGSGQMRCGDDVFEVTAGELIRNPPGGRHGLENTGAEPLALFVFEVGVMS